MEAFARLPWVTLGSDAGPPAIEGVFLESGEHPRAFGNVARFLGQYVRDRKVDTLEGAVHRLSGLPAQQLKLNDRGRLAPGMAADVVLFDPAKISDPATFAQPKACATGVSAVWVNGVQMLADGEPTGRPAGRFLKGPVPEGVGLRALSPGAICSARAPAPLPSWLRRPASPPPRRRP